MPVPVLTAMVSPPKRSSRRSSKRKRPYAAPRTEVNRPKGRCRYDRWSETAGSGRTDGVYGARRSGMTASRYGGSPGGAGAGGAGQRRREGSQGARGGAGGESPPGAASLRALLQDLRDEPRPPPTGVRSPGSAPSP